MQGLKKRHNLKDEEHFHDEWALSVSVDEIDIDSQFKGTTSPEYRKVSEYLGDVKNKRILNLGCGLGEEAVYMAKKGAEVVAIDVSKEMLNATKRLAKKYNVEDRVTYFHMSAEKMEFPDESFDGVVGCNLLHHVDIKKTLKEIERVMKKGAVGVFLDPLKYNPIINIYRIMAHRVRTDHEHPLSYQDLRDIDGIFPNSKHEEMQFFTLLIFIWFFIGEKVHPNNQRYWKKIINEGRKYKEVFKVLYTLDKVILKLFPFLKRFCWITVIRVQK